MREKGVNGGREMGWFRTNYDGGSNRLEWPTMWPAVQKPKTSVRQSVVLVAAATASASKVFKVQSYGASRENPYTHMKPWRDKSVELIIPSVTQHSSVWLTDRLHGFSVVAAASVETVRIHTGPVVFLKPQLARKTTTETNDWTFKGFNRSWVVLGLSRY